MEFGYIYLVHIREFISRKKHIYKIGKTRQNNPLNRIKTYPSFSRVKFLWNCDQHIIQHKTTITQIESDLIKQFKKYFTQKNKYGNEYFQGNYKTMIKFIKLINGTEIDLVYRNNNRLCMIKDPNILISINNVRLSIPYQRINKQQSTKLQHINQQTGIECYTCNLCGFVTKYERNIKNHMKISKTCIQTQLHLEKEKQKQLMESESKYCFKYLREFEKAVQEETTRRLHEPKKYQLFRPDNIQYIKK